MEATATADTGLLSAQNSPIRERVPRGQRLDLVAAVCRIGLEPPGIPPDARLDLIKDSRTWVIIDQPERTAQLIGQFARRTVAWQRN